VDRPDDEDLDALLTHLQEMRGVDFSGYKRTSLARRIRKRMATVRSGTFAEYGRYLDAHDEEFAQLFDTVLINVTSFLRDADTWQLVAERVVPELLDDRGPDEPVRAWVAGCATGEEAYTVAMLLCDGVGEKVFRQRVKIYATDADPAALAVARRGRFPRQGIAETLPPEHLERYFEIDGSHAVFRRDLRGAVIFGRHNLMQDPPISHIDLLTCRNTLMYFTQEAQTRVLGQLHFALRPNGFLVLGRSEALATTDLFAPYDLKRRVFRRTHASKERAVPDRKGARPDRPATGSVVETRTDLRTLAFEVSSSAQALVNEAGVVVAINNQARSLFGLTLRDEGRQLHGLELSYRPVELRAHLDTVQNEQHAVVVRGVEWQRGNERQWFDVALQPVVSSVGTFEGTCVSFTVVTGQHLLQEELERSKLDLETAYEELQSAVEELETTNEELQSTNEELETTNEELQSTNEELETINDELRRRTGELDEVNGFLEAILTSLRTAVVVVDGDVRIRVWNRHAEEMWGLRSDEVSGDHLMNLDIGLPVEHLRQPIRNCLAGEGLEQVTLDAVNRRGRSVRCHIRATPLRDQDEAVIGAILLMDAVEAPAPPAAPG
jgi:two-component system CheB/CheR fusion protein